MCPAEDFPPGRVFVFRPISHSAWSNTHVRVCTKKLPPGDPPGSIGNAALAVRRNLGSAVPHPGLRLRQLRAGGEALQERRPGLSIFAFRQSDRRHVRAPHGGLRRRRSRARDGDRHGGGHAGGGRPGEGRRSRRRLEGDVRFLPLYRRGLSAALRRHVDAGRRLQSRCLARGGQAEHQDVLSRKPDQSGARSHRHRRSGQDRACGRRDARRRQCVRDAAVSVAARARRRLRGLFGDQTYRRPGPLPRRHRARLGEVHPRTISIRCCGRPARRCRRSMPGCC